MSDQWEGMEVLDEKPTMFGATPKKEVVPDELPSDNPSELQLISTLAYWGSSPRSIEVAVSIDINDFYNPLNKFMFQAIRSLQGRDADINNMTLVSELEKLGYLGRVGGPVGVNEILGNPEVERPETLVDNLKEKRKLREIITIGSRMVREASGVVDSRDVISMASESITRLATDTNDKHLITDMTDLVDDLLAGRAITTSHGGHAMSWGDPTLDDLCPIPRGEPTLVVARPGVGKSALAVQIVVATIRKGYGKPLFLSLEMNRDKIKARVAAHLSHVNSKAFRDAQYDQRAIASILGQREILSGMKVMVPRQQCQVEEIESLVRYAVDTHGCDCVVLDQFSHIHPPREAKKEQFAIANSMMSQKLTALAKNLNLGWVTLGQINRDGDDTRRPNMKDLADTDRLAKDAAIIFGMWNKGDDDNQETWGTIIKNRDDGFKGWFKPFDVDYGTCTFKVLERETTPKVAKGKF